MLSESLLFKIILFLYFKIDFFSILTYLNDSIFIEQIIYFSKNVCGVKGPLATSYIYTILN